MKVATTGGRDGTDFDLVRNTLGGLKPTAVCHGGARGFDNLVALWALNTNTPCRQYKADWGMEGPSAGPIRNERMLRDFKPDVLVAFPGGRGTEHCVLTAKRLGIKVMYTEVTCES